MTENKENLNEFVVISSDDIKKYHRTGEVGLEVIQNIALSIKDEIHLSDEQVRYVGDIMLEKTSEVERELKILKGEEVPDEWDSDILGDYLGDDDNEDETVSIQDVIASGVKFTDEDDQGEGGQDDQVNQANPTDSTLSSTDVHSVAAQVVAEAIEHDKDTEPDTDFVAEAMKAVEQVSIDAAVANMTSSDNQVALNVVTQPDVVGEVTDDEGGSEKVSEEGMRKGETGMSEISQRGATSSEARQKLFSKMNVLDKEKAAQVMAEAAFEMGITKETTVDEIVDMIVDIYVDAGLNMREAMHVTDILIAQVDWPADEEEKRAEMKAPVKTISNSDSGIGKKDETTNSVANEVKQEEAWVKPSEEFMLQLKADQARFKELQEFVKKTRKAIPSGSSRNEYDQHTKNILHELAGKLQEESSKGLMSEYSTIWKLETLINNKRKKYNESHDLLDTNDELEYIKLLNDAGKWIYNNEYAVNETESIETEQETEYSSESEIEKELVGTEEMVASLKEASYNAYFADKNNEEREILWEKMREQILEHETNTLENIESETKDALRQLVMDTAEIDDFETLNLQVPKHLGYTENNETPVVKKEEEQEEVKSVEDESNTEPEIAAIEQPTEVLVGAEELEITNLIEDEEKGSTVLLHTIENGQSSVFLNELSDPNSEIGNKVKANISKLFEINELEESDNRMMPKEIDSEFLKTMSILTKILEIADTLSTEETKTKRIVETLEVIEKNKNLSANTKNAIKQFMYNNDSQLEKVSMFEKVKNTLGINK